VPKDYAQAVVWFQKAAEQGDAKAQAVIGLMVQTVAEQGDARAQAIIGSMYEEGRGVPQDSAQAVAWYRKGAEQGYAGAQFNLGVMYATGQGVSRDDAQAYMWLNLAADQGHESAVKARDSLNRDMTPSKIEEGQRLTREWLTAHPQLAKAP